MSTADMELSGITWRSEQASQNIRTILNYFYKVEFFDRTRVHLISIFQMLNSSFNFTGKESFKWWLSLNIPAWICYLGSTYIDPGFIQKDTQNYENAFLKVSHLDALINRFLFY